MPENLITASTRSSLEGALLRCSLPGDPKEVVGHPFLFCDVQHYVAGSVLSMGGSAAEGLKLYVTSRRFRGIEIDHLVAKEDCRWVAVSPKGEERHGELVLL